MNRKPALVPGCHAMQQLKRRHRARDTDNSRHTEPYRGLPAHPLQRVHCTAYIPGVHPLPVRLRLHLTHTHRNKDVGHTHYTDTWQKYRALERTLPPTTHNAAPCASVQNCGVCACACALDSRAPFSMLARILNGRT